SHCPRKRRAISSASGLKKPSRIWPQSSLTKLRDRLRFKSNAQPAMRWARTSAFHRKPRSSMREPCDITARTSSKPGRAHGANEAGGGFTHLLRRLQQARDNRRHALPAFGLGHQLLAARTSERVILGAAIVLRRPPFGRN